jgi:hypothetical protein
MAMHRGSVRQASEEADDALHARDAHREMPRIGVDAWSSIVYSNIAVLAIVIGTAQGCIRTGSSTSAPRRTPRA